MFARDSLDLAPVSLIPTPNWKRPCRTQKTAATPLLYEQIPVGNNDTFKWAQEGKRQVDKMTAMPDDKVRNV